MPTTFFPRLRLRVSRPLLIALSLFSLIGSVALGSVAVSPEAEHRSASPLAPEDAVGQCPTAPRTAGGVRTASVLNGGGGVPAVAPAGGHPEGKNSPGCLSCHEDVEPSHASEPSALATFGCIGCHGGDGKETRNKEKAHGVKPRFPELWGKDRGKTFSGNPERAYTLLNREDPRFIKFINPGDLRVAHETCGASGCHGDQEPVNDDNVVLKVRKHMMTHGGFLYGAALYNNGAFPLKDARFGESYSPADLKNPHRPHSLPQRIQGTFWDEEREAWRLPTPEETLKNGWLLFMDPLPRWEVTQVGNILRVFERGGLKKGEVGNPAREEEAGRPDVKLSLRGHGTLLRTDPVFLGLQKTRLLDPTLNFPGTNDQPGDYRSGGCTACHNVYANDPDPFHSGPYARFGNRGESFTADKALKAAVEGKERGHPIRHGMTNQIPTSQCITCHIHPGTNMLASYLGYTWWDNETDGEGMYPREPLARTAAEKDAIQRRNPEGGALRGKWGDPAFLETELPKLNPKLKHTQFAQFHGHGWIYRAVYKRDRKGNLLDVNGDLVPEGPDRFAANPPAPGPDAAPKAGAAVHLRDIHLEKGMHCVDCHFSGDNHGTMKLYSEPRAASAVECTDCHGTIRERADPTSTDPSVPGSSLRPFRRITVTDGPSRLRWRKRGGALIQFSAVNPEFQWEVPQVLDTITPGSKHYNEKSRLAKTIRKDGKTWGAPAADEKLAHTDGNMACYTCHTSWTTACFGCHLSMTANQKKPQLHNEGGDSRNWTSYNFQTLRDDIFMLGRDGTVTGNRVTPIRSSCAVLVSSQNANREWLYQQQQTVSAEGFSGTAFSSYVPHTVRGKETKACSDCHVSRKNDNNGWMANLLLQGSNAVNFIGRYCYVATGKGLEAVMVTERDEPQAVIGSYLHRLAYPDLYMRHQGRGRHLETGHDHEGHTLSLQQRGEYLYAAEGEEGLRVYDIANVDNKGFSERIVTAPVSPLGQKFYVRTRYATDVAAASTMALDPARTQRPENEEGTIHPLYGYLYVTDRYEGLILVPAATLLDGNPTNNFLKRALTWNPDGILNGASSIRIAGEHAYVTCDRGLVIVNISDPLQPKVAAVIGAPGLNRPRSVAVQFRYAFVCDADGLKVVDVTEPAKARLVPGVAVPLAQANDVYVSRTYAYVAAGEQGLAIVDVENPEVPKLDQLFHADGTLDDARAVRVGMTNNSTFAYVADGKNGLRVVQLTAPDTTPGIYGYSPRPTPVLIATYKTHGPAVALSEGLDRDRAVDESGNQLSVFGRRGSRPFDARDVRRILYTEAGAGPLLQVTDAPPGPPTEADPPAPTQLAWSWTDGLLLLPLLALALTRQKRTSPQRRRERRGIARGTRGRTRKGKET
jgi:hypothetical protein